MSDTFYRSAAGQRWFQTRVAAGWRDLTPGAVYMPVRAFRTAYGSYIPTGVPMAFEGFHFPQQDGYFQLPALPEVALGGTPFENVRLRFVPLDTRNAIESGLGGMWLLGLNDLPNINREDIEQGEMYLNEEPQHQLPRYHDEQIQQWLREPPAINEPVTPGTWDLGETDISDAPTLVSPHAAGLITSATLWLNDALEWAGELDARGLMRTAAAYGLEILEENEDGPCLFGRPIATAAGTFRHCLVIAR